MNVTCGGRSQNKELDTKIHKEAERRAASDMEYHPCGCSVCYANALLTRLQEVRKEYGQNPFNGYPVSGGI